MKTRSNLTTTTHARTLTRTGSRTSREVWGGGLGKAGTRTRNDPRSDTRTRTRVVSGPLQGSSPPPIAVVLVPASVLVREGAGVPGWVLYLYE